MPFYSLAEIESAARERLPASTIDYFAGGSDDEVTVRENRAAWERIALRPRYLVDVSTRDLSTSVLGEPLAFPLLIAPTAFQQLAHPEGELATARAAGAAGVGMILSTFSTTRMEDVRAATPGPLWFQLYVHSDRGITRGLVERAEAAGFGALVLTVDVPVLGRRERDVRNGFALPPDLRLANLRDEDQRRLHDGEGDSGLAAFHRGLREPSLSWKDLDWLGALTRLPILVKGILRADDACRCLDHGVRGVIVSNHGGRQLDGAIPGIRALPEIADAVEGRLDLLVDGGVRRGTDVLKAIASGARAVLVGRPAVWGLAAGGTDGVGQVLEILREEFDTAMALTGAATVGAITGDLLA